MFVATSHNQGWRNPKGGGGGWGNILPPIILLHSPEKFDSGLHVNLLNSVCITWIREKTLKILVKTFFVWSSVNLLSWKKSWSRFIPPMLKVEKSRDKIANYPPRCSTKIGIPGYSHVRKSPKEVRCKKHIAYVNCAFVQIIFSLLWSNKTSYLSLIKCFDAIIQSVYPIIVLVLK